MSRVASQLLPWFDRHGRHDLPWQRAASAYPVWVSEIMLQQTQVGTVIPYFERFMQRFPDVHALAEAPLDAVLAHWSGLGYYARARNLHRAAQCVAADFGGELPRSLEAWQSLPGVGRSTAGAIMALAYGERHAILDGNVKRVLVRLHGIEGWPGASSTLRVLWERAEQHTPQTRVADYTQAIMDLGATVCTRARPRCADCPLEAGCMARTSGREQALPQPRPRRVRPQREARAVLVQDAAGRVLLERRPARGIWGGLFSLPELQSGESPAQWAARELGVAHAESEALAPIAHAFTHFDLTLKVWRIRLALETADRAEQGDRGAADRVWYAVGTPASVGLAAPIGALLARVAAEPLQPPRLRAGADPAPAPAEWLG